MSLGDLTERQAVLDALAEFDSMGRESFLSAYGYRPARSYFILHAGKRYDSKAIAAAAHGHQHGRALSWDEFSGGESTVARQLRRLGFTVTGGASPDWTSDELIIALDYYLANRDRAGTFKAADHGVIQLSGTLRGLALHPQEVRQNPRFRNAQGVALKLHNFSALDPQYSGKGMDHGAAADASIWDRWSEDPGLHAVAMAILEAGASTDVTDTGPEDEDERDEGRLLLRRHRARERDRRLAEKKKRQVLARTGRLACEVCDFESSARYGSDVAGIIDVHHVIPLHVSGPVRTKLKDLSLLCPNCHRAIHKHSPWLTPNELQEHLRG